jgi:hypothetical protein
MVKELVINGIDKLVGITILGKRIKSLKVVERFGRDSAAYAFTMAGNPNQPAPRDFDSEFEVYLGKFPKQNNSYELFCMGWHGITCVYLLKEEIQNKDVFISYFEDTLNKLRKYSEDEKRNRS